MGEVELEISFILDAEASAGAKFIVIDVGGKTKATQSHKVKIKLIPFKEESPIIKAKNLVVKPSITQPMIGKITSPRAAKGSHKNKILLADRNEK